MSEGRCPEGVLRPSGHRYSDACLHGHHDVGSVPFGYFDQAKAKFATGADGWLVAYARVHGATVERTSRVRRNPGRRSSCPMHGERMVVSHSELIAYIGR